MIPKFRAWSKVNFESPEMRGVRGIDWHGSRVWFNDIVDDETPADWADFDDVILMQSIGLFDKNGVEIFEGDVVTFEDCDDVDTDFIYANKGVIEYAAPTFHITNRDSTEMEDLLDGNTLDVIVLGNIHEHPELVEGSDGMD